MDQRTLPNSTITTSFLGLGGAYLVAGLESRHNMRLVDMAYDGGVRHFDVAPLYGLGTAEEVLGKALSKRRSAVTIATKVGLPRPRVPSHLLFAHAIYQPIKAILRLPNRQSGPPIHPVKDAPGNFNPDFVVRSLTESLRLLRTDYVDVLLLHEVSVTDITSELLETLKRLRDAGTCRAIGPASSLESNELILRQNPGFFDVSQFSWNALDAEPSLAVNRPFQITHRPIMGAFAKMMELLERHRDVARRISEALDKDLMDPANVADLLVAAALMRDDTGIVLAASRLTGRVSNFCRIANDPTLLAAGKRFREELARERLGYPSGVDRSELTPD